MFVEVQVDLTSWFEEVPFQGSSAHIDDVNLSFPSLYATFILYHIFLSLSRGFEKVFQVFFEDLPEALASVLDATFILYHILYHILSRLSRGFRKFLKFFFRRSCELFTASLSLTAIIVYHTCRDLSRGFSNFFEIIFPHPFSTISYFQFPVGVHASYTLSVRRRLIINIIEIMSHWFIIRHMI